MLPFPSWPATINIPLLSLFVHLVTSANNISGNLSNIDNSFPVIHANANRTSHPLLTRIDDLTSSTLNESKEKKCVPPQYDLVGVIKFRIETFDDQMF